MFFKSNDSRLDLSTELRGDDWNLGTLRDFDFPLVITAMAFEPVLSLLAVASSSHIHIFGKPAVHSQLELPEPGGLKFLQFSVYTFQMVGVDNDNVLHVWDLSVYGRPKHTSSAQYDPISFLTISPSHAHAFIALQSGEMRTYDLACHRKSGYKVPNMWKLHEEKVAASGMPNPSLHASIGSVVEVVIHPRDLNLLFVAYTGGVILCDLTERSSIRAYELVIPPGAPGASGYGGQHLLSHRHPQITAIAIHPSGFLFACGYDDGTIALWAVDDEDEPVIVKTLDELDINILDPAELEHHLPADPAAAPKVMPVEREPIFKLSWSGFSNSSDPRGGETALVILGGLVAGDSPRLSIQWLPAFNPAEPEVPPGSNLALPVSIRAAMRESFIPKETFVYYTAGVLQDYILLPRASPHFSNSFDPTAVLLLSDAAHGTRSLEAYQFPPPVFTTPTPSSSDDVPASEPGGDESLDDLANDLTSTLDFLTEDLEPHQLRLPELLGVGHSGIHDMSLMTLSRDSYETLTSNQRNSKDDLLVLNGGLAWADESHANELKLSKYSPRRFLITNHADLSIQFSDISAQLLIHLKPDPLPTDFPNRHPELTIDLTSLLSDPAIYKRTSSTFINEARIASVHLTTESLECVVVLRTGEVIVYRLNSPEQTQQRAASDSELILLEHVLQPSSGSRFHPHLMLAPGKGPVFAIGISDIGFIAVAYADGDVLAVDMRTPAVILRHTPNATSGGPLHLNRHDHIDPFGSLMWTVCPLTSDLHQRVRLVAIRASGDTHIFTISRSDSSHWTVEPNVTRVENGVHTFSQFLIDSRSGVQWKADRHRLQLALQSSPSGDAHAYWITVGSKGARCASDITGDRIGKADWGSKVGTVQSAHLLEKNDAHVVVAITDRREVLVYSLPHLELLQTIVVPNHFSGITLDDTGDFITYLRHSASGLVEKATYSTFFNMRRAYGLPDIDFGAAPIVPAQPQPVSIGPTSILSSWFRFGGSMTGESVDTLLGGPDRPLPVPKPQPNRSTNVGGTDYANTAASVAAAAAGVQATVYDKLSNALNERGQMLGDLEERFNSLQEGSSSMVAQAKRLAAQQSAKGWFGF